MKNFALFVSLMLIALFSALPDNLKAQSACCPDFYLADAVDICPAEGACVHDSSDPIGQIMAPMAACQENYHTYTIFPNDPTFTYTWFVTGGTPLNISGNPCTILWGTGNQGTITVIIADLIPGRGCSDTIVEKICLIDGPQADFALSDDTVCTMIPVSFTNNSLGGSVFFWDFGDGTAFSGPTPAPHAYIAPGTYTVVLTVTDMGAGQWVPIPGTNGETQVPCGCTDTISKTIVVLPGEGPIIDTDCCFGTVCPGDTSSFCTPMVCGSYNWSATNGTIISGAGTNCITVQWNPTYTGPTTVSLQSCPSMACQGSTTLNVPVLYPNLPIGGPTTVCVGSSGSYTLPSMPGTYYNWTVNGGPYSFNQTDRNVTLVNITFFAQGSYWVKCEYNNPLAGCNGVDSVLVNVLPIFSIFGPETVCEGDSIYYNANGSANWTISPAGPTILTGNGSPTIRVLWTPGNYTILATASPNVFCNPTASKQVEVIAKPILNSIVGNDTICKNKNHTYSISSNVTGSPFYWNFTSGTGTILSEMGADSDSVVVKFTGPGPWTLSVYQEIEISPGVFCTSLDQNLVVYPFALPTFTGQTTVCVDAVETYIATGPASSGPYNWIISPSNRGTIQSGQGTNAVTIKWHGSPTTATLKVSNCSGSFSLPIVINGPPTAVASYNMTPVFCVGDVQTLILSTPSGVGYSYQWYKNGSAVPIGGISSNLSVSIAPLAIGTYQFHVIVTLNGCSIKSNTIHVEIKDCTVGGGGGQCDVKALFWAYVVCDSITLVNLSQAFAPATITGYTWSSSGPGTGTFSPNNTAANPGLTVNASGLYTLTLTITSSTGCVSTWVQQFNVLLPNANFTFTSPVCANSSAYFTAIPNNPNYNYFWTFGDGATSYDPITEHSYANPSPPLYNVTLLITDNMGCMATRTIPITVNPTPNCTVSASDTIICPGDFAVLSTCPGTGNSYQWFWNGTAISGANSSSHNAYDYGEYWVSITNGFGCSSISDSIFIYLHQLPVANITGDGLVCGTPGGFASFFLTTPFNSNYTYNWSSNPVGASFSPIGANNPLVSLTLPISLPAVYEFIVNVTDITTGCMKADTFCVTFYESPTLILPFLSDCEGSSTVLTPTPNNTSLYSYQWSNGATTPAITASAVGFYGLTITDLLSGCTASAPAGFIHPLPDLSLFPTGCRTICQPDSIQLYIPLPLNAMWPNNTYPSAYPVITWYQDSNYGLPIGSGPFLNYPGTNSGPHQINVVVQNSFGCSDTSVVFCLEDACCNIILEELISHPARCPELPNGWFTITLDPASTGGPFTITSSPLVPPFPTTITPGIPLTVSNLAPGVYSITISDPTGVCMAVYDVIIDKEKESCCFAEADSLFTKILTSVTYTSDMVWDGKYYLDDNVIVTVSGAVLDITVVDVVFGECAGIVFQNGGRLRSSNSVYRPCDIDKTWKGLKFIGSDDFDNIINESTFKNAEVALYFMNGADAVISNNLFSNCNYGIRVENNNTFNHPVSGNRFVTDEFFPDFSCMYKYTFITNASTYGIYSTGSRFLNEVSHNQFVNSKKNLTPRTYGIYQTLGGGVFSENTFTDMYNSIWLQSQLFYSDIENNEIEANIQPISLFPCIYINTCNGPIVEINNNEFSNNYNKYLAYSAIYAASSNNVSMVNNDIDGFNFGILAILVRNFQISSNQIRNSQTYGIYFYEQANSKSYVTCNSIKMKNFIGTGFMAYNMAAQSEVSSNCITDCRISMDFRSFVFGSNLPALPKIRNNFLYNYSFVGINVQGLSGNIGTIGSPGMNTLYSNLNTAVDINSTSTIQVADNYGMFNISFPTVQITSNNPYHSTASCGHQIFNMPSQGNLNVSYVCDNFSKLSSPLTGTGGNFKLMEDYHQNLGSSSDPFAEANMILANLNVSDMALVNDIINSTSLSENEKALIKYGYFYRHSDFENARAFMNLYTPKNMDEQDFKTLCLYDLDIIEKGWPILSEGDISILNSIKDKESVHSNFAISLLNNTSTYRDHLVSEPVVKDVEVSGDIKHIDSENFLTIYPNPTSGKVFIELISNDATDNTLEIFDVSGKKVFEYEVNFMTGGIELDIQKLGEGFYFVTLADASGFVQKGKIVKVQGL
ncbi:MAG: T9SS type A sorting domain-containing protein [Bacteroidales bacterium]|nr:T9SS type A sorting domain-containing protein [Bacteroidales bacterium]MCF8454503.1 T9SS type A sorting domain-containing protein [Bacteroidales bacterium]